MRFTRFSWFLGVVMGAVLLAASTVAQQKTSALTGVNWVQVTGNGPPTVASCGVTCSSLFYGLPYTDRTNQNYYIYTGTGPIAGWTQMNGAGAGTPGGTTGAAQYNNGGVFGGLNGTGFFYLNGASAPTVASSAQTTLTINSVPCLMGGTCTIASGGTVTTFTIGGWPSWLTPTVTNPTTTPSLGVVASAIPNTALATQTANTLLGALVTGTTPGGLPVPSCDGATNALIWTPSVGFGCNTLSGGGSVSLTDPINQTMLGPLTSPEFSTGTISGNVFTLDNLSTIPASWTMDVTSPATALASLGGSSGGSAPGGTAGAMQYYLTSTSLGGLNGTGIPYLNGAGAPTIATPAETTTTINATPCVLGGAACTLPLYCAGYSCPNFNQNNPDFPANWFPLLTTAITPSSLSIPVGSTTGVPFPGCAYSDTEFFCYDTITSSTLELSNINRRGLNGTTAAAHGTASHVTGAVLSVAGSPTSTQDYAISSSGTSAIGIGLNTGIGGTIQTFTAYVYGDLYGSGPWEDYGRLSADGAFLEGADLGAPYPCNASGCINVVTNTTPQTPTAGYSYIYANATSLVASINGGAETTLGQSRAFMPFATGQLAAIVTSGQYFVGQMAKAGTVENFTATAASFTCATNPTLTLEDCGATAGTCSSPTAIANVTITAANTVTSGTITSSLLTAGDFFVVETTAGVCTVLNASGSAEYRMN